MVAKPYLPRSAKVKKFHILPYSAFCVFSMILTINMDFSPKKSFKVWYL